MNAAVESDDQVGTLNQRVEDLEEGVGDVADEVGSDVGELGRKFDAMLERLERLERLMGVGNEAPSPPAPLPREERGRSPQIPPMGKIEEVKVSGGREVEKS